MRVQLIPDTDLRSGWRPATVAIARRTRRTLLAHPWSPSALADAQFGPNAMRHMEQCLAALKGTALSTPGKMKLIAAVDDYVLGNAMHAIESLGRADTAESDLESADAAMTFGLSLLETGEFPELSALYAAQSTGPDDPQIPFTTETALTEQFELGLTALLDGLAARLGI